MNIVSITKKLNNMIIVLYIKYYAPWLRIRQIKAGRWFWNIDNKTF